MAGSGASSVEHTTGLTTGLRPLYPSGWLAACIQNVVRLAALRWSCSLSESALQGAVLQLTGYFSATDFSAFLSSFTADLGAGKP